MDGRKLRVLVVNTVNTGLTGITTVIWNYASRTADAVQYDFVLCGRIEDGYREKFRSLGGNVLVPPCSRVKHPLKYSRWLLSIMRQSAYDAVHVHGNSGTMYFEMHAAKRAGIEKRIAHSHSTSCRFVLAHRLLKPLLNRELTHAAACSDQAGKWLYTRKYTVLPNGIDTDRFAYSPETRQRCRRELGLEGKCVVGHVGYMDVEKNQLYLLRAFRRVIQRNDAARLLLIGDGRQRGEIERFIQENNLSEYVQLLGKRADAAALYQGMDVFALPSLHEGLGIALLEAQTAGLPCIASTGVPREADVTGRVKFIGIEDSDLDVWADSILAAAAESTDRTGTLALVKKSGYDMASCAEALLALYE